MSKNKFAYGWALIAGFLLAGASRPAQAQSPSVPSSINFQGRLTNATGSPINGVESIVFNIWNQAAGGVSLWTETQATVVVSTGVYNVSLGSVNPIPPSIFASTGTYLGIAVGGDPEMTPRIKMQTTPYAFNASSLISILPVADLFTLTPVNQAVGLGGYTVPAGKNLIIVSIDNTNAQCFTAGGQDTNCFLSVSGAHTATNLSGGGIAGPGDVLASTAAAISFGIRGALVPATVTVILQDLSGSGGSYTAPTTQSAYFGTNNANALNCTGTFSINGFAVSTGFGGILSPTQTVTNNMGAGCLYTLDGYVK